MKLEHGRKYLTRFGDIVEVVVAFLDKSAFTQANSLSISSAKLAWNTNGECIKCSTGARSPYDLTHPVDEWIDFGGNTCPVPGLVPVEVEVGDGYVYGEGFPAGSFAWGGGFDPDARIKRYKIIDTGVPFICTKTTARPADQLDHGVIWTAPERENYSSAKVTAPDNNTVDDPMPEVGDVVEEHYTGYMYEVIAVGEHEVLELGGNWCESTTYMHASDVEISNEYP